MTERANLEVKFRCDNLDAVAARLADLTIPHHADERQEDIYFHAADGRLKLRIIDGCNATLIAYRRPDESGTRLCDYILAPIEDCAALAAALALACGERGRVVKQRTIHLSANVRIHLDRVASLGTFVEFEAVLSDQPGHDRAASAERLEWLTAQLGLAAAERIGCGYAELMDL